MRRQSKFYPQVPIVPSEFEHMSDDFKAVAEALNGYDDVQLQRIRHLGNASAGGYFNFLKAEEESQSLIINFLPFANGAVKRTRTERKAGLTDPILSTLMALRAAAIHEMTGADVLTVPNDGGFPNPLEFTDEEIGRIKSGDLSPYSERINQIIDPTQSDENKVYDNIYVTGYSQGAVVAEKVAPLIDNSSKVIAIEPTNIRNWGTYSLTKLARIGYRYMAIGMSKVRQAAADSGIHKLQLAQEANPPLSPIVRNRFMRRILTGKDFGVASTDIPVDVYTSHDSTICEPVHLLDHVETLHPHRSQEIKTRILDGKYKGKLLKLGHVATDNVLIHGAIIKESMLTA